MSDEIERCKHCWEEPVIMHVGSSWAIFCNCLMFSCTSDREIYHDKYEDAIKIWNKEFGRESCSMSSSQASQSIPSCVCDSQSLLWLGCTCEYARWKHKV